MRNENIHFTHFITVLNPWRYFVAPNWLPITIILVLMRIYILFHDTPVCAMNGIDSVFLKFPHRSILMRRRNLRCSANLINVVKQIINIFHVPLLGLSFVSYILHAIIFIIVIKLNLCLWLSISCLLLKFIIIIK
jgi:hypothetical protein